MPTFDAGGDVPILILASIIFGVSIGMMIFALGELLKSSRDPVAAVIGDAQRRIRREKARQDSGSYSLFLTLLPVAVGVCRMLPLQGVRESLAERYAEAGWPGGLEDDELVAISMLVGLALVIPLALILFLISPFLVPAALVALMFGPGFVSGRLSSMAKVRTTKIQRTMPFVLDLLVLTMRAGASFRLAVQRVTIDFEDHPIGLEFRAALTDMEMGVNTRDAFEALAQRAPMPAVRTFVDELVQSDELGRPVADTLEELADRTRERRIQEATEIAGKAKVKVLVPGMLVLVATMLLLFAPFIVKFWYQGIQLG